MPDNINEIRRRNEKEVSSPGKFESEPLYVPFLYTHGVFTGEVLASQENRVNCIMKIEIDNHDRNVFPELENKDFVYLHESNSGFVSEIDRETAYAWAAEINSL